MDNQMATVLSVSGNRAEVELGSGETKAALIPRGLSVSRQDRVLVDKVSGKYLIINVF